MDWSQLAGVVGSVAPTLGGLLGSALGPAGGIIGSIAGRAIAGALGVPTTPEAVSEALAKDKLALEKLRVLEQTRATQIVEEARIEVERIKAEVGKTQAINESIRAEAGHVSFWHWRHLLGYLVLLYGINQLVLLNLAAFVPKLLTPSQAVELFNATTAFTVGLFGLLGYVAADTTNRVNVAITGQQTTGGLMNTIRSVLPKGK